MAGLLQPEECGQVPAVLLLMFVPVEGSCTMNRSRLIESLCFGLTLSLGLLLAAATQGCLRDPDNELLESEQSLSVAGRLIDRQGQPLSDVAVFIEDLSTAIAVSDDNGRFSFTADANDLVRIKSSLPVARNGIRLYFERIGIGEQSAAVGMSAPISLLALGNMDLGTYILDEGIAVSGSVMLLPRDQDVLAAEKALVKIGRWQTTTDAEGIFHFEHMPRGRIPVEAYYSGFGRYRSQQQIDPTLLIDGELPEIVLFPELGISGVILPNEAGGQLSGIEQSLRPLRRSYRVKSSPDVRWIRFDHRFERLEASTNNVILEDGEEVASSVTAAWLPIAEIIEYDFPNEGAYSLYYQFADENFSDLSQIFQLDQNVDRFGDSIGFSINDGDEVSTDSTVTLNIDLPATASRIRYAEDPLLLETLSWQEPRENIPYSFRPNTERSNLRRIYLQFQDRFGNLSRLYSAEIRLELFPEQDDFIVVAGGANVVNNRAVPVEIELPRNGFEFRIFDESDLNTGAESSTPVQAPDFWRQPQSSLVYTFTSSGYRSLFIQFRDENGNLSPVYQRSLLVAPAGLEESVITINQGDEQTANRLVELTIVPVEGAIGMRVHHDLATLQSMVATSIETEMTYELPAVNGRYRIYVQFVLVNDNEDTIAFFDTIDLINQ